MGVLHVSDFANEPRDKVKEGFIISLSQLEQHCHIWHRAYVPKEVKLEFLHELSKEQT